MKLRYLYCWLGGTFDPIHQGHLKLAHNIQEHLNPTALYLMPCYQSVQRPAPLAAPHHRMAMLRAALETYPLLQIDSREIKHQKACTTFETLHTLRNEYGPSTSLAFIIGADSWWNLHTWHRAEHLLSLAHLIIVPRTLPYHLIKNRPLQQNLFDRYATLNSQQLWQKSAGSIWITQPSLPHASASQIRQTVHEQSGLHEHLPQAVAQYIQKHHLY